MSARTQLVDMLAPLLPADWVLVPSERAIDAPGSKTLQVRQKTIAPSPAASGAVLVGYTLTLISPRKDITAAEDDFDDDVIEFAQALQQLPWLQWTDARKVAYRDQYPAYDFTVNVAAPTL